MFYGHGWHFRISRRLYMDLARAWSLPERFMDAFLLLLKLRIPENTLTKVLFLTAGEFLETETARIPKIRIGMFLQESRIFIC